MDTFIYKNQFGEGGFVVSHVSDWNKDPQAAGYYTIRMQNGSAHSLYEDEFAAFSRIWKGQRFDRISCSR